MGNIIRQSEDEKSKAVVLAPHSCLALASAGQSAPHLQLSLDPGKPFCPGLLIDGNGCLNFPS